VLLVVTYSTAARTGLRNLCRRHEETVVRRFGRAALLDATVYAAFLALRLRESYGGDVQIEQTEPFNEFVALDKPVREARARTRTVTRSRRRTPRLLLEPTIPIPTRCEATSCERCGTDGAIGTNPTKRPKARSGPTGSTAKPTDKTISWRLPIRSSPIRLP